MVALHQEEQVKSPSPDTITRAAQIMRRISATRQPVFDVADMGDYQETVDELNSIAAQGLTDEISDMIAALAAKDPRLAAKLAEDEQSKSDEKYFTVDAQGKRILRRYSIEDIYQAPDAVYLIAKILEAASVSLLYGLSGTGKTFTALHVALCVAHGILWHRRRVKAGLVWYINTEGARGLKKRLKAWYSEHPDLEPTSNFQVIPWALDLRGYFADLLYTVQQQGQKPALIVIDNFSMCTPGVNQNLQEEVAPILRQLNMLAGEYGLHVMIVHHTNKLGDANGTMAFRNHVDTMIELRKEDRADKDSAVIFTCQKARDDEPFRDIKTELKTVSLGVHPDTYEEITSCVVVESEAPIKQEALKDTQQDTLDILGDDTLDYTTWKNAVIEQIHVSKMTFDRAKNELLAKGYVRKVKVEGKKHDHYRKVITTEQGTSATTGSEEAHE